MADVTVIIKSFEETRVRVREVEDIIVIVPMVQDESGIFDDTFDDTFE